MSQEEEDCWRSTRHEEQKDAKAQREEEERARTAWASRRVLRFAARESLMEMNSVTRSDALALVAVKVQVKVSSKLRV